MSSIFGAVCKACSVDLGGAFGKASLGFSVDTCQPSAGIIPSGSAHKP